MIANVHQAYSQILRQQLIDGKKGGNLNFTEKRILKDLEEFEFNVNPEMGISAKPLKESIYKWHANIKGASDTPYDGGIFHFEITIPGDYPNKPPVIEVLTPLSNNFFVSGKYRSEMVEDDW
jgi:ubiquitin-protein ligase